MAVTNKTVWRSVRKEEFPSGPVVDNKPVDGVLYPSFEPTLITGGRRKGEKRDADVETFQSNGIQYVKAGGGTSLFDKINVFGTKFWVCFEIPEGTEIPESLKIVGPDYNSAFDANHYQIESKANNMRVDAYKGALDNLARNAIVRSIALAH
jgi:Tse2-like ADP-ribosyltransferase toxin